MILPSFREACIAAAPAVLDHLWQSTLFTLAIGVLTLAFRRNQARIRFGLWLAVSVKFLVPFALLVSLGSHLSTFAKSNGSAAAQNGFVVVVEQAGQPFTHMTSPSGILSMWTARLAFALPVALAAIWLAGMLAVLALWMARWQRAARIARRAILQAQGRELDVLRRLERNADVRRPLPFLVSQDSMEPGVFGILRPVLIWPQGISGHLDENQLRSILAHELWHVRRRDNFSAALHLLVEAIFWFHPLVWWIGAQLVEERERACDEEVLRLGNAAEVYAESILKACKFCVETPLSCISGVSGSNLKRRITRIMNRQSALQLTFSRKVLLTAAASLAVTGPIAFGLLHPNQLSAQPTDDASAPTASFETASIKPSTAEDKRSKMMVTPGTFSETSVTVKQLIEFAYDVQDYQLAGLPDWAGSERYDIQATWNPSAPSSDTAGPPPPPPPPPPPGMKMEQLNPKLAPRNFQAMVKTLLAERFNLKLQHETRDLPVYELVVASTGSKLTDTPSTPPPPSFHGEPIITVRDKVENGNNEVSIHNAPVKSLATFLSEALNRRVFDKTGLNGNYNADFHWSAGSDATDSITAAVNEQLGLTLEPQHGPVDTIVVDQVDKPSVD